MWGDGESYSAELGASFSVPGSYNTFKELTVEICREQYSLEIHLINALMLKSAINSAEAKHLKNELAEKYKKFLGAGEEDE